MQKKHYYLWVRPAPPPQEYFGIELGRKKQLFILIRCVKIHTHTSGGWQCYSERMETRL